MPLVGLGGYVLHKRPSQKVLQTEISVEFFKLKISTSYDKITGKLSLYFDTYRISYDGIKVRLDIHLKTQGSERGNAVCSDIDLFEYYPIETTLPSKSILHKARQFDKNFCCFICGEFRGQKKLDFTLNIPKDRICPTSFISSSGSLTYRLVALLRRDKNDPWKVMANQLLLDFKGYYNLSEMEFGPSVDFKLFLEGKITSLFTLNTPVLLVGRDTNLNANLELGGVLDYDVDVILTFMRKIKHGEAVQHEIILLQKKQADSHEDNTILRWNIDVPPISRATYANELTPFYSVRYFVKYEATFKPINEKGVLVDGNGIIEVKVGTTSEPYSSDYGCASTSAADRGENLMQVTRSSSVTSMPPAYSQLSSRYGSMLSLETQPPSYDDL